MDQKRRNDAAVNRWTRKVIAPIIENEPLVALKFLERHNKEKPVGDPGEFALATMQCCTFAALDIARSLTKDTSLSLQVRANAMTLLVSHNLAYPQTVIAISGSVLRSLLLEEPADPFTLMEMVTLVRAISLSEGLWEMFQEEVRSVLRKACGDLEIPFTEVMDRTHAIETADKCRDALREILCLKAKWKNTNDG